MTSTRATCAWRGLSLLLGLALVLEPTALRAQGGPPGCRTSMHRQFDFWIGEWTVTDSSGTRLLGRNRITLEDSGCIIHEQWTSNGTPASTGQSLNAYDLRTRQWGQDWVGSGGEVLHLRGGLVNGRMVLEGDGLSPAGAPQRERVTWTPLPDGRVRQFWESSTDGGKSWSVSFDGWYRKER